ncbi:MAG: hypothetical protein HQ510_12475 [Candidatus Marinimicrobia bacterium]|nr:hypothetical protein [Candidatus Neomarinimicrobiota bacterium]
MKKYIIALIILASFSFGKLNYYRPISAGITFGRNIGGSQYEDTKILGVSGEYKLNPSIGIGMEYKTFHNSPSPDYEEFLTDENISLVSLFMNRYHEFKQFDNNGVKGMASVGGASMTIDGYDKIYFMLGIGLQIELADRLNLELSLRDYMKEFRIPFTSFPEVNVAAIGGGGHYMHFNVNLSMDLGDVKSSND